MKDLAVQKNEGFLVVHSLEDAMRVSDIIANSALCPPSYAKKPGDVLVALQMGQELGLKPMQALQNIAVINGRPNLWGDGMIAVCRQSREFEYIKETFDEATMTATCVVKRKNEPEATQSYSLKEATNAGLAGKTGPWKAYPKRMLQMRARGFVLRDTFADILRGFVIKEEAEDTPRVDYSNEEGYTIDAKPVEDVLVSDSQIEHLKELIPLAGSTEQGIFAHLNIESFEQMTETQWHEICKGLNTKIKKKEKLASLEINKVFNEFDPSVESLTLVPEKIEDDPVDTE